MYKKNVEWSGRDSTPDWIEVKEKGTDYKVSAPSPIATRTKEGVWHVFLVQECYAAYKIKVGTHIVLYSNSDVPGRLARWLIKKFFRIEFEEISIDFDKLF